MSLELAIYKNYKELCEVMDWKVKSGNTKISQLKDLERYCKYHKEGNKFIIDEIYENPLPKEDNRFNGNNSVYKENIDKLILHMCSETYDSKYNYIELTTNTLMERLHIINKNFKVGRNNINKFSRYLEVPIETIYDFYNSTYKKNKDIIEASLKRFKNKALLDWYKVKKICLLDDSYRKATDGEIEGILEIEQEVLRILQYKDKKEVFLHGAWNSFQNKKNEMLRDMMKIKYDFEVYHIVTTKSFRKMILEESEKEDIEWELNFDIQDSANKSCKNRHEKVVTKYTHKHLIGKDYVETPFFDKDKNRMSDSYVDDTKRVVTICIDCIDPINLVELLKDIKDEKYTYLDSTLTDYQKEWLAIDEDLDTLFG